MTLREFISNYCDPNETVHVYDNTNPRKVYTNFYGNVKVLKEDPIIGSICGSMSVNTIRTAIDMDTNKPVLEIELFPKVMS